MGDFDTNQKPQGVSVWDHVWNGTKTGAMGGALFGGVGAIPGAIAGGAAGLANGLWESHKESVDRDAFTKEHAAELDASDKWGKKQGLTPEEMAEVKEEVFLENRQKDLHAKGEDKGFLNWLF